MGAVETLCVSHLKGPVAHQLYSLGSVGLSSESLFPTLLKAGEEMGPAKPTEGVVRMKSCLCINKLYE